MEANNSISFEYYCGRCCCPILKSGRFGYILSCSDFLCSGCHDGVAETITCPSCRNSGVRVLSMADSSSLPPEVCNKMADSDRRIEELLTGLRFQIKHYKTVLSRVTSRFGREKKEYLRKIQHLESQMTGPIVYPPQSDERPSNSLGDQRNIMKRTNMAVPEGMPQTKLARPATATPSSLNTSSSSPSEAPQWRTGSVTTITPLGGTRAGGTSSLTSSSSPTEQEYLSRRPSTSASTGHPPSMGSGLGPGLSLSGILDGSTRPATSSQGGRGQGGSGGGLLPGHGGGGGGGGGGIAEFSTATPHNNESTSTGLSSRHFGGNGNSSQHNNSIMNRDMTGEGGVMTGEMNHGTDVNNTSNNRPQTSSGRPLTPSTLHLLHQRQQQQQHGGMGSPFNGGGRGPGPGSGTGANTGTSFHAAQQQQSQLPRPSTTGGQQMTRIRSPHAVVPMAGLGQSRVRGTAANNNFYKGNQSFRGPPPQGKPQQGPGLGQGPGQGLGQGPGQGLGQGQGQGLGQGQGQGLGLGQTGQQQIRR